MLVILLGRVAVAVVYVAGLLVAGEATLLAGTVAAAAAIAWLARPVLRALSRREAGLAPLSRREAGLTPAEPH